MPKLLAPEVKRHLEGMKVTGHYQSWGPTKVHDELCRLFPREDGEDPISLRTVESEWASRSKAAEWTLQPEDPDPGFTLQTLAWVAQGAAQTYTGADGQPIEQSAPSRRPYLTVDQVAWLRVVHAARPDLTPSRALSIAGYLLAADKSNDRELALKLSIALGEPESEIARPDWAFGGYLFRETGGSES